MDTTDYTIADHRKASADYDRLKQFVWERRQHYMQSGKLPPDGVAQAWEKNLLEAARKCQEIAFYLREAEHCGEDIR